MKHHRYPFTADPRERERQKQRTRRLHEAARRLRAARELGAEAVTDPSPERVERFEASCRVFAEYVARYAEDLEGAGRAASLR